METRRNPIGRRPNPGSRIHLTSRKLIRQKTAAKRNLGKAVRKATLAANENRREISRVSRLTACCGAFFLSAFQRFSVSAFQRFSVSAFQRFSVSVFQHFSFTQIPLSPATPISPPSSLRRGYDRQAGPIHWLFQGPPAESKFLAARVSTTSCHLAVKVRIRVIPEASSRLGRHEEAALAF